MTHESKVSASILRFRLFQIKMSEESPEIGDSSEDLEAKEKELRRINDELDAKRERIVKRAAKLLETQENLLRNAVAENSKAFAKDCALELQNPDIATPSLSSDAEETETFSKNEIVEKESAPRKIIPKKVSKKKKKKETLIKNAEELSQEIEGAIFSFSFSFCVFPKIISLCAARKLKDLEMESSILGKHSKMGKNAALRLQKARYKTLEKQFEEMVRQFDGKEKEINIFRKRCKETENELVKVKKNGEGFLKKMEAKDNKINENMEKMRYFESEMARLRQMCKTLSAENKEKKINRRTVDIRLSRALKDAEKYRKMLAKVENSHKNTQNIRSDEMAQLKNENKALKRQRMELLSAFKKQMKLIDILKKQKIHIEAAKVLEISERNFTKSLEIGENLT